jgi:heme exporter protein B
MSKMFLAVLTREIRLAWRIGGGMSLALVFFLILVTLIPFAIGPDLNLLSRVAPAVLWIGALLSTLIGLDRLFQADEEDGTLDLIKGLDLPLELSVLAKAIAHWMLTGLPLALAAPVLGLMLALPAEANLPLMLSLLVGTPGLTFTGAIGAAVTATLRRGGLILSVVVAPLTIPVLIFGVSSTTAALGGTIPFGAPLAVLAGLTLAAIVIGTAASAFALRRMTS